MSYQRIFRKHNPGPPWTCYFCHEPIASSGRNRDGLAIHHLDGNHANDELTNLAPTHRRCHSQYHTMSRRVSEETKAKLRKPKSDETRKRMSAAQSARPKRTHTDETKAKLSAIVTGRRYADDVRVQMRAARREAAEKRRNAAT